MQTTKQRLTEYRAKAANASTAHYSNWRAWRRNIWNTTLPTRCDGKIFADTAGVVGNVISDDKTCKDRNSCGWYSDNFQDALIYGYVEKLRTSRGVMYIPGRYCTDWDGITLYFNDIATVPKGAREEVHDVAIGRAIGSARHYAEQEAERALDDDARYQAEQQVSDLRDDIKANRKKAHEIIRELRGATLPPSLCGIARLALRSTMREVHDSVRRIRELQGDYWEAVL